VTSDQLTIYLQDHHAGARFGGELARRAAGANQSTEYGEFLERLAAEIEEDRIALEAIMKRCEVGSDRLKDAGAWTMEKLGRLKFLDLRIDPGRLVPCPLRSAISEMVVSRACSNSRPMSSAWTRWGSETRGPPVASAGSYAARPRRTLRRDAGR
jgi:hypothetical protein